MTIRKGVVWGHSGSLVPGRPVAQSDADLAKLIWAACGPEATTDALTFGLHGGDVWRTVGAPPAERMTTGEAMCFPIDHGTVEFGEWTVPFVAHVVWGHRSWFRKPTLVAMNAAFVDTANLGPRSHPNDGFLDITEGSMTWRDWRKARSRFESGTHVPHPSLRTTRINSRREFLADSARSLWIDGVAAGRHHRIVLDIVPDAAFIVL